MRQRFLFFLLLLLSFSFTSFAAEKDTVPSILGEHFHFNTRQNPLLPENDKALNQIVGARIQLLRVVPPRDDIQRNGPLGFTPSNPESYKPGYTQTFQKFRSKGLGIGFVMLNQNKACGTDAKAPWLVSAGRHCFNQYAWFVGSFFKPYNLSYIESWNEPNLKFFWGGTIADFIAYQNEMIAAFKAGWHSQNDTAAAKPMPHFIGPGVSGTLAPNNWLDQFLAAGGANQLDGISFHSYPAKNPSPARRTPETGFIDGIFGTKARIKKLNAMNPKLRLTEKKLYITETGYDTFGHSYNEQAKLLPRLYAMCYYGGVDHCGLYSLMDARNRNNPTADKMYGLFNTTGPNYQKVLSAKPALQALGAFNHALYGYSIVRSRLNQTDNIDDHGRLCLSGHCTTRPDGRFKSDPGYQKDWALVFHHAGSRRTKVAIWTEEPNTVKVSPDLGKLLQVADKRVVQYSDTLQIISVTSQDLP